MLYTKGYRAERNQVAVWATLASIVTFETILEMRATIAEDFSIADDEIDVITVRDENYLGAVNCTAMIFRVPGGVEVPNSWKQNPIPYMP